MSLFSRFSTGAAMAALAAATAPAAIAQQTTSQIEGVVSGNGAALGNATVQIVDTRTSATRTVSTNSSGRFNVQGLPTGGPYTITVTAGGLQGQTIENVFVNLQGATTLSFNLTDQAATMDTVVVTAAQTNLTQLAIGPGTSFGLETLENLPSISRDIRDTIRLDPRVIIDATNFDNISCIGGNNRFNAFTIDGVRTNDPFGLNASGFPNRNTLPIPFDAVRETSVEFSPFDVEYGQFSGCAINVVTKSGSNEFSGSAFGVFNSDGLTGETIDGEMARSADEFNDWNWGAQISGPIIKDRLFFSLAYEEVQDGGQVVNTGPGPSFANTIDTSVAEIEQIQAILENQYGFDTGGIATILPEESTRWLGRLDWQINDDHRLEFTYGRLRELFNEEGDFIPGSDFEFANTGEVTGSEIESYSARLFSQWTENFSTEIRASRFDTLDIQGPLGGGEAQSDNPIPSFVVQSSAGEGIGNGPGIFRSANALNTQIDQIKLKADYLVGDHTLTVGYELDQLDVFNLFADSATGVFQFDSVDDLIAGQTSSIEANGSFSGDINDAAASFSRSIHSLYLQDEWQATPELTLTAGLRYDFYRTSDAPQVSPAFVSRYGFTNTTSFNEFDILLPRFGFTYESPVNFFGETTFRGGVGVFSGSDPTVWFSNTFSNFGSGIGGGEAPGGACTDADLIVADASGQFTGIPQCVIDQQQADAAVGAGRTDAIDPNFDIPSVIRGSFGILHYTDFNGAFGGFFDDWTVQLDYLHTANQNSADFVDLTLTPIGIAPDGRFLFNAIDPLLDGCDATFIAPRAGFSGPADQLAQGGVCDAGGDDQDILLTNVRGSNGNTDTISISFAKDVDFTTPGLGTPGALNFTLGYAYNDAEIVNPTTSSTATSNFEELAVTNINFPDLANSQFNNTHNITVRLGLEQEFFRELSTRFDFFYNGRSGRPFSFTFAGDTGEDVFGDTDDEERILFYVPTGPNDPLLSPLSFGGDPAAQAEFFEFLATSGLDEFAGQIAPRNEFNDPWFHDLDFRFSQELPGLPGIFDDDRFLFFVDIENLLNLIDDSRNVLRTQDNGAIAEGFPVLTADVTPDGLQYIYPALPGGGNISSGDVDGIFETNSNASLWAVQFGIRYEF
ncbi:MAG: TonB-dependent receptor [Pseudomonadota bacterium]